MSKWWQELKKNYLKILETLSWASKKHPSNHSEHPGNHKLKTTLKTLAATHCSLSFALLVLSWEGVFFIFFTSQDFKATVDVDLFASTHYSKQLE